MKKSVFFKVLSAFIGIMLVFVLSACDLGLSIPEYAKKRLNKTVDDGGSNHLYTVTFESNGGTPVNALTVESGGTITLPAAPTKDGYFFVGWFTDNGSFTNRFTSSTPITADITVYAKWTTESPIESPNVGTLMPIPAGTFTMGSPVSEPNHYNNETQHSVTLGAFYMGKYEVTQEQYEAVMGNNPSSFTSDPAIGEVQEKRPVEQVSWYSAIVFCNILSIQEGLTPAYSIDGSTNPQDWGAVPTSDNADWNAVICNWNANGYRLPTEAEWEYACRAGTTTAYNTGDDTISDNIGWYGVNSGSKTHEAGKKPANAYGLHDMHGNVYEWCWDRYGDYPSTSQENPMGASSDTYRVARGGGWSDVAENLRSAFRRGFSPASRDADIGFRVVRLQV